VAGELCYFLGLAGLHGDLFLMGHRDIMCTPPQRDAHFGPWAGSGRTNPQPRTPDDVPNASLRTIFKRRFHIAGSPSCIFDDVLVLFPFPVYMRTSSIAKNPGLSPTSCPSVSFWCCRRVPNNNDYGIIVHGSVNDSNRLQSPNICEQMTPTMYRHKDRNTSREQCLQHGKFRDASDVATDD